MAAGYSTLSIFMSFVIIAISAVVGMSIMAFGQVILAIREIALNTRTQEVRGQYKVLELMATLITFGGGIVLVLGVIMGAVGMFGSMGL